MNARIERVSFLLIGLTIGVVALGQESASQWEVPEEVKTVENPLEAKVEVLEEGEALFKKQCLMCHGESLKGDGPAVAMFQVTPPDLSTVEARERLTDGEIFYKVSVGKKPMPAMESRLSKEERWKLVHYLRSLQAE